MLDAPQHDWSYYEAKTRDSDAAWNRGLSTQERFDLYASLFNTIWNARQSLPGDWDRLDNQRWQEKLTMRRRMVDAFHKLDEFRRERSASNDPS
jgi:hypothetical protein